MARSADFVSASRFLLAAGWLVLFLAGRREPQVLGPIALAAAFSDFIDGQVSRRIETATPFGRWIDNLADVSFVLTALICEAAAGAIPFYIPALIAASFAQYVIDSLVIHDGAGPVASRLGHLGGVINYLLVIVLALAPAPRPPGAMIHEIAPLLAIFYAAAMVERTLAYRRAARFSPRKASSPNPHRTA